MKVSDYIAKKLFELGSRHVFMVTGGGAMHLNDSFARVVPFHTIFNHHEQACAIGAEGLFRGSGQVGVVNLTTGPGGLNALTGVMGQWTDSIPAIYVSGQVKFETTILSCREISLRQLGDQEVDIISIVKPLTKYSICVTRKEDVRYEVEKAWHLATTGRMGPVWLDIPMNIQGAQIEENDLKGYVPDSDIASNYDLQSLVEQFSKAQRPVIIAGHGIRLSNTIEIFKDLIEHLQIPIVTTFNGFDLLPDGHPLFCGRIGTLGSRGGNFTLQNADLVLSLGSRNNIRQVSYNWENFAHRAVTISVDIDMAELTKPTFKPTYAIHADLKNFLPNFLQTIRTTTLAVDPNWLSWSRGRNNSYPVVHAGHSHTEGYLNPYIFMREFTNQLPEKSVVVAGNGSACVILFQAGVVKEGQRVFWNSGCASMGFDLPAAIGAAVGQENPVWCLAGDGSLQMNLQELATVGFSKLNIKLVYLNNGGYASIRQTQSNFFHAQYGCGETSGLGFPNIEILARAYGLPYVKSENSGRLNENIRTVMEIDGPCIWEVMLPRDYIFEPKLSSEKLPDGRMVSKPLEDLFPFLDREEFKANMWPTNREVKS